MKDPVLAIRLCTPLLFCFSQLRGLYCFRVLFWRQTKEPSEFSTSQKWSSRDGSMQCLMDNTGSCSSSPYGTVPAKAALHNITTSQKWSSRDGSMQCLMDNTGSCSSSPYGTVPAKAALHNITTSQKWSSRDGSMQCLMDNTGSCSSSPYGTVPAKAALHNKQRL